MSGSAMQIREHMEVVGSDGGHVGTVDNVEGNRIKLTRRDDPDGSGAHHHFVPMSSIASIDGNRVTLNLNASEAKRQATQEGGTGIAQNSSPGR
jgi:hypothetical protein